MKLHTLNLANFRGFEQLEMSFEPDMTLIAGVNGSGKSAILHALTRAASYVTPRFTPSKESSISFIEDDIHAGKFALTLSIRFEANNQRFHAEVLRTKPDPTKIEELKKRRDEIRFAIRQTKKKSNEETDLLNEIRYIEELLKGDGDHFSFHVEGVDDEAETLKKLRQLNNHPLVIFYNTSRFLTRLPPRLSKLKPFDTANAYSKALHGLEVSLNDFAIWFRAAESGELGEHRLSSELLDQLQNVLEVLLPGFRKLELQLEPKPRFFMEKNGTRLALEQLSDGERGLLALAFDLTRRLSIANPESENPIAEGKALVMIDEIELHLHPLWQRQVLRRFKEIFCNCQFIAATHSPQVVGEVESRCIRFLLEEKGKIISWTPPRSLGLDSSRILEELMDVKARNAEIEDALDELFRVIDKEDFISAKQRIEELKPILGENDPELTRARLLMAFIEDGE